MWHVAGYKQLKKMDTYEITWLNTYASFLMDTEIDVYFWLFILGTQNQYNKWSLFDFSSEQ